MKMLFSSTQSNDCVKLFKLYCIDQLIGNYKTEQDATMDAFELILEGIFQTYRIVELPKIPEILLNTIRTEKIMPD